MEIFAYLALALVTITLIGALFLAPACSLGHRPLLSGYTIIIYMMTLYIALSAAVPIFFNNMTSLFYPEYSGPDRFFVTLVVNWLGIVLFVAFYQFFSRHRRIHISAHSPGRPSNSQAYLIAYVLVLIGLVMKGVFILRSGGLHTILVMRSGYIAQNLGLSERSDNLTLYLGFFSIMADAAACWLLLEAMRVRKDLFRYAILCIIVLAMTFLITPKRLILIVPLLALITGFGVYIRPLRINQAPIFLLGAVTFSMATIAGRVFLPAFAAGVTVLNWTQLDVVRKFAIKMLSADIAYFDATVVAIYGREAVLAKFGGWWGAFYRPNIEPFLYVVPRAIWPWKPESLADMSTALRAIEYGVLLGKAEGGFGIGLIGTAWIYGEFLGLVFCMALLGWAAVFVDRFLVNTHRASAGRILIFAVSATVLFHVYRQGTLGWVFLNFFQTALVFYLTTIALICFANQKGQTRSSRMPALNI